MYGRPKRYEEFGIVLDIFPEDRLRARGSMARGEDMAQIVGEDFFTFLEAAVPHESMPKVRSRIYVGKDGPRQVLRIIRRVGYESLTASAKAELEPATRAIVESNEKRFTGFFNTATPVTPRLHAIELIPGIGKKYLYKILEEREVNPFKDLNDMKERIGIPDPVRALVKRILTELSSPEEKYYLFAREPYSPEERRPATWK
ncbi:MAG: DUF655 domain-containing protein [Aigarchaeota archaeon]|nr:DUF655 domain-containing protein [Aigarchaeota archaeon]